MDVQVQIVIFETRLNPGMLQDIPCITRSINVRRQMTRFKSLATRLQISRVDFYQDD